MSSRAIAVACSSLASRYAGVGAPATEVHALQQKLQAAVKAVVSALGEGEVEDEVVASTIWFIRDTARSDPPQVLVAQFPATLRTLLGLLCSPSCSSQESGLFLHFLSDAASSAARSFELGSEQRTRELARASEETIHPHSNEPVASQTSGPQTPENPVEAPKAIAYPEAAASTTIPRSWKTSLTISGEWYDPDRSAAVKAARRHSSIGFPHFAVTGAHPNLKFQCILRWGHDDLAVELRSGHRSTDREAFDDVMRLLSMCPDEPYANWRKAVVTAVGHENSPARVAMRNIVTCGVPRYVCTATWFEPERDQRSTTPRASMSEALAELVQRVKERNAGLKPLRRLTVADQLKHSGLLKPTAIFRSADRNQVAQLSWQDLDGVRRHVESTAMLDRCDAVADAISRAHALDDQQSLDWRSASNRLLGQGAAPDGVYFESGESVDGHERIICLMRWRNPEDRIVKGPPRPTRRQALVATAELERHHRSTRLEAKRALASGTLGSRGPMGRELILRVLHQHKAAWTTERANLVSATRTPEQERRLRDLTTLLALLDPSNRSPLDPVATSRLVEAVLRDSITSGGSSTRLPPESRQAAYLNAMCRGSPAAGAPLVRTAEFDEACTADNVSPETAIQTLITLRLMNRKDDGRLTLSQEGVKVLLRQPSTRAPAFAVKYKAALKR